MEKVTVPTTPIFGACHCEAVSYVIMGHSVNQFLCHCDACRRLNGGSRLTGAVFPKNAFALKGDVANYKYQGGKGQITLSFCPTCSTQVFAESTTYPEMVIVRANTFKEEKRFSPGKNIFTDHMPTWDGKLPD